MGLASRVKKFITDVKELNEFDKIEKNYYAAKAKYQYEADRMKEIENETEGLSHDYVLMEPEDRKSAEGQSIRQKRDESAKRLESQYGKAKEAYFKMGEAYRSYLQLKNEKLNNSYKTADTPAEQMGIIAELRGNDHHYNVDMEFPLCDLASAETEIIGNKNQEIIYIEQQIEEINNQLNQVKGNRDREDSLLFKLGQLNSERDLLLIERNGWLNINKINENAIENLDSKRRQSGDNWLNSLETYRDWLKESRDKTPPSAEAKESAKKSFAEKVVGIRRTLSEKFDSGKQKFAEMREAIAEKIGSVRESFETRRANEAESVAEEQEIGSQVKKEPVAEEQEIESQVKEEPAPENSQKDIILAEIKKTEEMYENSINGMSKLDKLSALMKKSALNVYAKSVQALGEIVSKFKTQLSQVGLNETEIDQAVAGIISKAQTLEEKIRTYVNSNKKESSESTSVPQEKEEPNNASSETEVETAKPRELKELTGEAKERYDKFFPIYKGAIENLGRISENYKKAFNGMVNAINSKNREAYNKFNSEIEAIKQQYSENKTVYNNAGLNFDTRRVEPALKNTYKMNFNKYLLVDCQLGVITKNLIFKNNESKGHTTPQRHIQEHADLQRTISNCENDIAESMVNLGFNEADIEREVGDLKMPNVDYGNLQEIKLQNRREKEALEIAVEAPAVEEKVEEKVVSEPVTPENPEPVAKPVKKTEPKKEHTLSEYMQAYAKNYKEYYNKDKWVDNNRKNLHDEETRKKQRKINTQMKSLIGKQLQNEIGPRGQDAAFVNKLNAVNDMDIEDLAKNDGAVMKLFQIASSGVYEDGGKRIRLTTTQRLKLSDVLVSVSEKRIANENKLAQENAKANQNAQQNNLEGDGLENGK